MDHPNYYSPHTSTKEQLTQNDKVLSVGEAKSNPNYLVDMLYITELTKMSDKWFYKLIKEERFPKPMKMGRSSRWKLCDVDAWIEKQISDS